MSNRGGPGSNLTTTLSDLEEKVLDCGFFSYAKDITCLSDEIDETKVRLFVNIEHYFFIEKISNFETRDFYKRHHH